MRISLDAGALCGGADARYGTYIFTENMIEALSRYDKQNTYIAYTFCDIADTKQQNISYKKLPKKMWMSYHVTAHEIMEPNDVFLGLSQALPLVSKARIFTFLHGLSFLFYKDMYEDLYPRLKKQLEMALRASDVIFVTSSKISEELHVRYDYDNAVVIQPGVPFDMEHTVTTDVKYALPRPNYFLFVGMNHPIKRVDLLVDHFRTFRTKSKFKDFALFLAGNFQDLHNPAEGIYAFPTVSREMLRYLYAHARAYVTASQYESFHFPVLEALSQKCPVIGYQTAIIPEMKPFVMSAHNERDFIYWMEQLAHRNPILPDLYKLYERFSWKKTVNTVKRYYHQKT
ncbi:glycosyltransferase family 4 protein [Candidatus Microgenomates bacterium]|nr:glycosyltransferase family 4 protein [Candidatus Microgenomates bacterium]